MKKYLYLGLLISLTILIVPAFSLAQTKDNSIKLNIGEETGYIPTFNYLNIKLLNITQPLCKMAPCPKMVKILVNNKYIQTLVAITYSLNEGDSIDFSGANIKVSTVDENSATFVILDAKSPNNGTKDPTGGDGSVITPVNGVCPEDFILNESGTECLKPSPKTPIAPLQGSKETVGTSFFLAPINGECPENHLISDDGKTCIKLGIKVPIAPREGVKEQVGVSSAPLIPVNGECPDGFAISPDGKECSKILPKIIIAPKEGFKEVIFESDNKTTIKDNNTKKETVITSKDGFGVVVSIKSEGEKQAKEVTIESKADSDNINISTGKILVSTNEAVEIKENKIFLNKKEIKIMPDTASEKAIEKLGDLGFKIELKDVSKEGVKEPTYEAVGTKEAKLFWLFNVKMKVSTNINAQTGEVSNLDYPWWSFFAR
jgi:hypothetical protein